MDTAGGRSMNRYAPLWSGIVDSSIWDEPDYVVKIFITMLAKKDLDHVVRGNAFNIARWSRKTEKEVLDALKVLAAPDKRRLEPQPFEGRRIERVEEGWLVLNGSNYVKAMQKANRNAYQAGKQREYRANAKLSSGTPLAGEGAYVAAERRGDLAECDRLATPKASQEDANARAVAEARAAVAGDGATREIGGATED
jgi:hypothetical protein